MTNLLETAARFERGRGLAFIIGPHRGGTTLLRKLLDSHSALHAPAETWFLLPLMNMLEGGGAAPRYEPKQAAAAVKSHLTLDAALDCCRAFAGRFYAHAAAPDALWFIDKTPRYLEIAHLLPSLFPESRFIVLTRDPRAVLWSRRTWRHAPRGLGAEAYIDGVARDVRLLARFASADVGERTVRVRYEDVCVEPAAALRPVCALLGVEVEPDMIAYGEHDHHEGYGDELSRGRRAPHTESIDRWRGPGGLSGAAEAELLARCGADALAALGLGVDAA